LLRLMYAFTYCAGISRTSCPSPAREPNSAPLHTSSHDPINATGEIHLRDGCQRRTFRRLVPTNDRDVFGERVMNNFSLLAANRLTHLKVLMLVLACVTLVVGFGLFHNALPHEPTSISTIVARVTATVIRAF